jgi:predicted TPR repeat methyltransferase
MGDEKYDYTESAPCYDQQVKDYDSYGHDVLFGMAYEFVQSGETLLDLGIGTGLASHALAKTGLKVTGLDADEAMLDACRNKNFAVELKCHDLNQTAMPYGDHTFNHVISCGVFHFLDDLTPLFSEVRRLMKPGGIFAFTIAPSDKADGFMHEPTEWGVPITKHGIQYIRNLLEANGLEIVKEQRLLIKGADKETYSMLFSVLIARIISSKRREL